MKAVFLDRDGVICRDFAYISSLREIIFLPHLVPSLLKIAKLGFEFFIISNQSGVARGLFSERDVWKIDTYIKKKLIEKNIIIRKSFYCFHHPDFTEKCSCRKPNFGLFTKAIKEFSIQIKSSFSIGDKIEDIIAGRLAGVNTIFIKNNLYPNKFGIKPDYTAISLMDAARWIKEKSNEKQITGNNR